MQLVRDRRRLPVGDSSSQFQMRSTPIRVSPGGGYRRTGGLRDQPSRGVDIGRWSILEKQVFYLMLFEVS